MPEPVRTFLESIFEAFVLEPPVYEFGYGAGPDWLAGSASSAGPATRGGADGAGASGDVERLEDLTRLPFANRSARTVVAAGALEHVFEPSKAVEEMSRILAPGGVLVLSCSQSHGSELHHAERYWHPTTQAIQRLLAGFEATLVGWQGGDEAPHTLFGVASKTPVAGDFLGGLNRFLDRFQRRVRLQAAQMRWWRRLGRRLAGWVQAGSAPAERPARPADELGRRADRRRGWLPFFSARHFYAAQFVVHLPACERLKHRLLASCLPEEDTGSRLDTTL